MNNLRNRVQLIGYLGKDPEVKKLDNGNVRAAFSLATTEVFKNAQGKKVTDTQWHQLVAWGKTGELAERLLEKGSEVAIDGKLVHRSYTDKSGMIRYITEVVVREINLLDKKKDKEENAAV